MSSLMKRVRRVHKDQGGFTLIEVLVVMTILGILAAIVSISMLGVTSSARAKAKTEELQTVQAAFDAMLSDQQVDSATVGTICAGAPTSDMTQFPAGGQAYAPPNSVAPHATFLATHYLRQPLTSYNYSCDDKGDITQGTQVR